jgi:hypothetical protein
MVVAIATVTVVSKQQSQTTSVNKAEKSKKTARKANFTTVKVAGQDVKVDGHTGQMAQLTPEEARKLAEGLKNMVSQSTEGLVQVQHQDGSVSMDLRGRFQNVTVARVNKDGSVSRSCVDNPRAAGRFFGIDPNLIEHPSVTRTGTNRRPAGVETQR